MRPSADGRLRARRRALAALLALPLAAAAQIDAGPYVPSPSVIVDEMLKLGAIRGDDYLIDLGSGDGRIPITAAQRFGARGFGVDIKPELVKLANENAARAGVADKVRFERRDLFETSLAEASVVTLYLLPGIVTRLVPKILAEMKPGARVVSHDYPLAPWKEDRFVQFDTPEKEPISGTTRTVLYLYTVPARVGGEWRLELPPSVAQQPARLTLAQHPVGTRGSVTIGKRVIALGEVKVSGDAVRLAIPGLGGGGKPLVLEGRARGDVIEGTAPAPWRATRP
ncbi:MAG: class I SAM-dependent methyltransferase [Burkholderiales bacterium]